MAVSYTRPPVVQPDPAPVVPAPVVPSKPDKPKRPLRRGALYEAKVSGPTAPDGTEVQCDLPDKYMLRNKGGSDGAGLCVFTSIAHSAQWQNVEALKDFRDWMTKYPGGGYPKKVDDMIAKKCPAPATRPQYVQIEGTDLDVLKLACRTGRMPAVTYSRSPTGRYDGKSIAHMVSLVHADDKWFCVLDNNYPGGDQLEWMTPDEFRKSYLSDNGRGHKVGWSVILLRPPPPPVPHN